MATPQISSLTPVGDSNNTTRSSNQRQQAQYYQKIQSSNSATTGCPNPSTKPRGRKGASGNTGNKKPQRGMGVAQLEKLRVQEELKQISAKGITTTTTTNTDFDFPHYRHNHQQQIIPSGLIQQPQCKPCLFDSSNYPAVVIIDHPHNVNFPPPRPSCLGIGSSGTPPTMGDGTEQMGFNHTRRPGHYHYHHNQYEMHQQQQQHFGTALGVSSSSAMQHQRPSDGNGILHPHPVGIINPTGRFSSPFYSRPSCGGVGGEESLIRDNHFAAAAAAATVKEEEGVKELPSILNFSNGDMHQNAASASASFSFKQQKKKKRVDINNSWGDNDCFEGGFAAPTSDMRYYYQYEGVEVVAIHRKSGGGRSSRDGEDQVVMEYGFFPAPATAPRDHPQKNIRASGGHMMMKNCCSTNTSAPVTTTNTTSSTCFHGLTTPTTSIDLSLKL